MNNTWQKTKTETGTLSVGGKATKRQLECFGTITSNQHVRHQKLPSKIKWNGLN